MASLIPPVGEPDNILGDQRKKSVIITNVPPGTKIADLIIYFQKESNGGGQVDDAKSKMLEDGKAVLVFDEEEVANRVLTCEHNFNGTMLQLEPLLKSTDGIEVFSLVSATLDPTRFTVDPKELNGLLINAKKETGVTFLETCEGFVVSGSVEQIDKTCFFLSRYSKPSSSGKNKVQNGQPKGHALSNSDDEENSLETMFLDVEPKLMYILQKEVNKIEKKCKMKIDWKTEHGKVHLSPNGKDERLFEQGKEELISLYQKEFQDLQEQNFSIDAVKDIKDLEMTTKELMQDFAVVIERGEKVINIFGKENDVQQVMQLLQAKFGKPRRGRKAYKEPSNGELPMPDTHAQAALLPLSRTLENGVVLSVHQGDITKEHVDVIVNAANERLDHGGGVAGAIVKQGGRRIQQESDALVRRYGLLPVGQVAYTGPGNLPCKLIYHAVGPQWKVHGGERSRQLIFDACINSFNLASKQKMSSVALPGISSGLYGVPKKVCAEMMFTAAESFAAESSSDNQLKDIRFVNIDTPTYEAFRGEFHNCYGLMKGEDANLGSNTQKNTDQKTFESTGRTSQVNNAKDRERKERADAAIRRSHQGRSNDVANDDGTPREHDDFSNKSSSGETISEFEKGFLQIEKANKSSSGSTQGTETNNRAKDKRPISQLAHKGKHRNGVEKINKYGSHKEEDKEKEEEKKIEVVKRNENKNEKGKETETMKGEHLGRNPYNDYTRLNASQEGLELVKNARKEIKERQLNEEEEIVHTRTEKHLEVTKRPPPNVQQQTKRIKTRLGISLEQERQINAHQDINQRNDELQKTLESERQVYQVTKQRNDELQKTLETERQAHQVTNHRNDELQRTLESERQVHQVTNQRNDELQKTLETERQEHQVTNQRNDELQRTLVSERQAHQATNQRNDKLQRTLESERQAHQVTNHRNDDLQRTLESERQAHQVTNQRNDELQRTLVSERQAHQATNQRNDELQRTLVSERQAHQVTNQRNDELQRTLESKRQAHQVTNQRNDELQRTLESERQAHQVTNQRNDELQRTLESERQAHQVTNQRSDELQRTLVSERERNNELLETQTTLQRAIEDYRASTESSDWILSSDEIMVTENLIGKGAWGSVTKGEFRGCEVAVKQIHELILSDHNRRLFEREIGIASRCRHPCLLQFIGANINNDDQSPLFVTELLDTSLRAVLHERALEPTEIITIALDVAKGLNYLHLNKPTPIIHRDISSANVLLWKHNTQWRAKVSDFGTANFLHQSMTACPGAVVYSAPESQEKIQTPKVDVYSFGVLLCEMIICELPDMKRRNEQVARVSNEFFRKLIRRCLNRNPASRPSMAEILEKLKNSQNRKTQPSLLKRMFHPAKR